MKNSSERAIHGFVQVGWYKPTSVFARLNVCTCISLPVMRWGLQAGPLLANGTRSTCKSIHSTYTNACILIPAMMFYDAKPQ